MSIGCLANLTHRKKRHVSMIRRIVKAAQAQAARPPIVWGCKQANASLLYVDHFERADKYCIRCAPLLGHPHRCFWDGDPKKATARYFRVRMLPVYAEAEKVYKRTLGDILEDLKARQKTNPYKPQGGKLAEHRARWKGDAAIEYFVENGMARLNIVADGRPVTAEEISQVKSAARVIFKATATERKGIGKNPEPRADDKTILRLEWNEAETVKQTALELA